MLATINREKIIQALILAALTILLFVACWHNITSINGDVGRHIKSGELIWQTKSVLKTNLFSFTQPEHRFIDHHWLSQVVFYLIYQIGGLNALTVLKTVIILAAFLFTVFSVYKKERFWLITTASFLAIFILAGRTEPRPEIFSYLFFSIFLFVLFKTKYEGREKLLWLLPAVQLLWVNFHVYFFLGPMLFACYFIDRVVFEKSLWNPKIKKLYLIGLLMAAATLANPNFLVGALYPLGINGEIGMNIAENKSIFTALTRSVSTVVVFIEISLILLALSVLAALLKIKIRIFEILAGAALIYLAAAMMRNSPFLALGMIPLLALNFSFSFLDLNGKKLRWVFYPLILILATLSIFWLAGNRFWADQGGSEHFGLGVIRGAQGGIDFFNQNSLSGPIFNNFDVGSILIWKLYPKEGVFVDGRPEAYDVSFFSEVYFLMLNDPAKWQELSEKYQINTIFLAHTDQGASTGRFLKVISQNKSWVMVYLDESAVIFVKNVPKNREIIKEYSFNDDRLRATINKLAESRNEPTLRYLGRFLFITDKVDLAIEAYKKGLEFSPGSKYATLALGYCYAMKDKPEDLLQAAGYFEKSITNGMMGADEYNILGVVYFELNQKDKAKDAWQKSLKIQKKDNQAQYLIENIDKIDFE